MSHLNFNIRTAEIQPQAKPFNPRANFSSNVSSVLWLIFAGVAVAGATFAIVWFA